MTLGTGLRILLRRWYVVLLVLIAGGGCLAWQLKHSGLYATHAVVAILPPGRELIADHPYYDQGPYTAFASTLVQEYNTGRTQVPLSSTAAPLYGVGIRTGVQVQLSNSGNQWAYWFSKPTIDIQVVGPSEHWVRARTNTIVAELVAASERDQARSGTAPAAQMVVKKQPLTDVVNHVAPGSTTRLVAISTLSISVLLTASALAVWTDRLLAVIQRRRGLTRPVLEGSSIQKGNEQ